MSTSLLYHAFGLRGYAYVHTQYEGGAVIFTVRQNSKELACSSCGSAQLIRRGQVWRRFRSLPIGLRAVWVHLALQRVCCMACGLVRQVQVGFADPRRSYTKAFARYAWELSRRMTMRDVARHLGVSWDVIKEIQKRNLQRRFSRPKLKKLQQIAVDEIAIGKGHRFLTIVLDLGTGAVVFVGEGKGLEVLEPFWRRLKASRARVQAVAMDMSPAYMSAVRTHLPQATIVFDHFHIIKLYHERLSDLRRRLYHEAKTISEKEVLKGTRWLLLKNPENLDPTRNEAQRLQEALQLNQPLATAYYLKEDLRQLWVQPDKRLAEVFLTDWILRAKSSGIRMLIQFAHTVDAHRAGVLAYYDYPISTGPLEGTNNKIKTMKRQAYGFRDLEFLKLKIMGIHEAKYALVG
jgi:transposase